MFFQTPSPKLGFVKVRPEPKQEYIGLEACTVDWPTDVCLGLSFYFTFESSASLFV